MSSRFGATDVHYPTGGGATAALVVSDRVDFAGIVEQRTVTLPSVADYVPGRFYERELPAIGAVLFGMSTVDMLIIDGYVDLDPDGRPGLGRHVWTAGFAPVVIGVAKTAFHTATHAVPVLRGKATNPLYVTAAGLSAGDAAELVRGMVGAYRLPDALRLVDRLARGKESA